VEEMIGRGVSPDTFVHNVLINGFGLEGNMGYAFKLFGKMIKRGLVHDVVTYNVLINGFCRKGDLQKACRMYDNMIDA